MKLPLAEQSFLSTTSSVSWQQWLLLQSSPPHCPMALQQKHIGHKCVSYNFAHYPRKISWNCPVSNIVLIIENSFRVLNPKNMAIQAKCQWWVDLLSAKRIPPLKNSSRKKDINVFLPSHFSLPGLPVLTVSEYTGASATSVNCHLSLLLLPFCERLCPEITHLANNEPCKTGQGLEGLQTKRVHG